MISAQISSSQDPQAACCRMVCRAAGHPSPAFADRARGTGRLPGFPRHRNSQPNHVIRRLNNTGAALKCWSTAARPFPPSDFPVSAHRLVI